MPDFFDNDTVALLALGLTCICGVFMGQESLCAAAIGAIGGYIGSHLIHTNGERK
ncbi:MAG: hypothetical protein ACOYIE_02055 [Agathobaculum sp.]|jgi:ABC-type branched-subunit amino acid transport system permease subunit|uniref:hypothetical protein n=1 Tax=Agathobaculum sp. TaxID=2048138 RepID=UPI003D8E41C0